MATKSRQREVYEILEALNKIKKKEDLIEALKKETHRAVWNLILLAHDTKREWAVPRDQPPYMPSEERNYPTSLLREADNLKYLLKSSGPALNQLRREKIVLGILEGIHPKDAEVLSAVIKGEWPFKKITAEVARAAAPHLFLK
jgi:hypothetical protein